MANGKRGPAKGTRPSGRQAGTPNKRTVILAEIARQYTDEMIGYYLEIIRAKEEIFNAKGESLGEKYVWPGELRIGCIDRILDRGWGKPTQDVKLSGRGGGPVRFDVTHHLGGRKMSDLSVEELTAVYQEALSFSSSNAKTIEHQPSEPPIEPAE